ncbi:hypothetical protein MTR_1g077500 [Medicago truncatula]|uniref:Uncharacterized protein n=1 Tax=Medicago truncatula TaxID=3880 RepID=A0A072VMQ8_MEDTR|nr:hypothetical protein MTR_1g077500 [Medicago truncatula]
MTIDELQSSLLVHEQHMKGHKEEGQVLHISNAGTGFGQVIPKTNSWRAARKLELVNSDICVPINPESKEKALHHFH